MNDKDAMTLAIKEALYAEAKGEVPVGAVVIINGEVIAKRHNERENLSDPTAHAELLALRDAAAKIGSWRLEDATLVVTLEPCPMCAGAAWSARLKKVVWGASNPEAGALGSLYNLGSDPRFNHQFEITSGVCEAECADLLVNFFANRR